MIIPKHLFDAYKGDKVARCAANLKPVGTGPYQFVDFKPGDLVTRRDQHRLSRAEPALFRHARDEGRRRRRVGGARGAADRRIRLSPGTCRSRTRSCKKLEEGGKGQRRRSWTAAASSIIQINFTDPWTEVDGERSSIKTKHPTLSDKAVRQALNLLVDRGSVEKFIYGRTGVATANFLNNPERFRSKTTKFEFNIDKANQILDAAGWKQGSDGIREKDGKKLKFVFQTSINEPRQKTQAIVKQACQKAGIDIELKSVVASVFFSSDAANPDTYPHFYCDLQMYTTTMTEPDPGSVHEPVLSWEVATKDNKWQGRNITRWRNEEYDKIYTCRRGRARPGEARRAVHQDERHGDRRRRRHPGRLSARRSPA